MQQRRKCGNPHPLPKQRKQRQPLPAPSRRQHASSTVAQLLEPIERARLTLHDRDPITGNEDILSSLFYEFYRGYTIYSTQEGRCCIHGKHGCIKLRGKFVCFPDFEDAKTLIKQLRAEGYTSSDSVEWCLSEGEFMWLNRLEQQRMPVLSRPMQRVS